jgi:recombination protein RecA
MYNEGISNVGSLLDLAMEFEILQKRGSWISYKGTQLAQGRDAAKEVLKTTSRLCGDRSRREGKARREKRRLRWLQQGQRRLGRSKPHSSVPVNKQVALLACAFYRECSCSQCSADFRLVIVTEH